MLGLQLRWPRLSLPKRILFTAVGPFSCYLCAVAMFGASPDASKRMVRDESSMRVAVLPGSPAARAGMADRDKVVLVNGVAVPDWSSLKGRISEHPGEAIQVTVEREGQSLVLSATPSSQGKLGLSAPVEAIPLGLGAAILNALAEPFHVNAQAARAFLAILLGRVDAELAGPVAIVHGTDGAPAARVLEYTGTLNSYFLWVPTLLALILFPRRSSGTLRGGTNQAAAV
jgi:membrane-associated protease RseP (regulator of RpoE activity)